MIGSLCPGWVEGEAVAVEVTRERIASTEALIRQWVRTTAVVRVDRSDFGLSPGPLVLKLEQLQHTGSFKTRGAFANLLLREIPTAGVVAASGGNHAAAVAYAARVIGVHATVFVPAVSSPAKIARIRDYGADLVVTGQTYGEALVASREWSETSGALQIHAFDQVETLLGAGTLAIELQQQAPDVTAVAAAVGGGGLLAGIAAGYAGSARILGAEPEAAPTLTRALEAGHPVDSPTGSVAVDSLAPPQIGEIPFSVLANYLDEVVLVSDEEIQQTQRLLWDRLRIVAEPGGCAALAAVLSGRPRLPVDEVVAVVISGANTTAVSFDAV
jgi:threonine dehydratase